VHWSDANGWASLEHALRQYLSQLETTGEADAVIIGQSWTLIYFGMRTAALQPIGVLRGKSRAGARRSSFDLDRPNPSKAIYPNTTPA
jgi:hypothetical protein